MHTDLISSSVSIQKFVRVPFVIVIGIGIILWGRSGILGADIIGESVSFFTITVCVLVIIAVLYEIYTYWPLMDKVWDSGKSLTFRKNGTEIEIPYTQIKRFKVQVKNEYEIDSGKEFFVRVDLSVKTKWGKSLKFMPATQGNVGRRPIEKIYEVEANINNKKINNFKNEDAASGSDASTTRPF